MTQEEKAKAYDEAVKRVETMKAGECKTTFMFTEGLLEYIFPELAGSENETIRKALINGFNKLDKNAVWYNGITNAQILDWLEKQGKHANFRNKIQIGDKVTRNKDGVLVNLSQLNRVAKKDEKQGEQKPADKVEPKFKVGQTIKKEGFNLGFTIVKIEDGFYYNNTGDHFPFTDQDNWELVEQQLKKIEQKPTDEEMKTLLQTEYEKGRADTLAEMQKSWSDEDEDVLEDVEEAIINYWHGQSQEDLLDWLKSIKEKVLPQPKQEWSEEDERHIDTITSLLEDRKKEQSDWGVEVLNKEIAWLKSLRPQPQWKPSDELLDVFIKNAIDFFESNFNPLTDGGVIGAFDDKEKMIEEFKEYMKEEGFNEEWI